MAITSEIIGKLGGGSGGIFSAEPVPLHTYWLNLGEIRVTKPSRAIFYAEIVKSGSGSSWGAPYPRMRWREITTGETHEHEFNKARPGEDEVFPADLSPGTWAAEITGSASSNRTDFTYNIAAVAAPLP